MIAATRGRHHLMDFFYLEDLDYNLFVIGDVDGLKDFAVFAAPELSHELKVILVTANASFRLEILAPRW